MLCTWYKPGVEPAYLPASHRGSRLFVCMQSRSATYGHALVDCQCSTCNMSLPPSH